MSETTRTVLIALGVVLLIVPLLLLLFMTGMMGAMVGWGMGGSWTPVALVLLTLVAGIVLLAIGLRGGR